MIIRIVKMTFAPEKTGDFLKVFHESAPSIRNFQGCHHLELYRDSEAPNIMFTYSVWESARHLDEYRSSELFKQTWSRTKVLFAGKPEAWSVSRIWNS